MDYVIPAPRQLSQENSLPWRVGVLSLRAACDIPEGNGNIYPPTSAETPSPSQHRSCEPSHTNLPIKITARNSLDCEVC